MTTANDIVTQLEELWENAEPGPFGEDDTIIVRHADGGDYNIRAKAGYSADMEHIRTLERAKPKPPEWEAVAASHALSECHKREVYFRSVYGGWVSESWVAEDDDLVDPVPLVEMPSREDLLAAFEEGWQAWRGDEMCMNGADSHRADAVLELLKRR